MIPTPTPTSNEMIICFVWNKFEIVCEIYPDCAMRAEWLKMGMPIGKWLRFMCFVRILSRRPLSMPCMYVYSYDDFNAFPYSVLSACRDTNTTVCIGLLSRPLIFLIHQHKIICIGRCDDARKLLCIWRFWLRFHAADEIFFFVSPVNSFWENAHNRLYLLRSNKIEDISSTRFALWKQCTAKWYMHPTRNN